FPPANSIVTTRLKRVFDYKKDYSWRCLACDYFIRLPDAPHRDDKSRSLNLNLLFMDGHVAMPAGRESYARLQSVTGPNGGTNNSWVRVNDIIGASEWREANRSPLPAFGGPNASPS